MVDLVSGVLSAIEQREQLARAAEPDAKVFEPLGDGQTPADAHIEANDPASVLRLCRSLRDIVNAYTGARFTQECHPEDERNNGYVLGMSRAVAELARGLGIEDTP